MISLFEFSHPLNYLYLLNRVRSQKGCPTSPLTQGPKPLHLLAQGGGTDGASAGQRKQNLSFPHMTTQSRLENWGFKRVEETSASTVHLNDQNEGTTDEVQRLRHSGQFHHEIVSLNKAKRLWGNISITTYNVESLSDDRIRNLINQMTIHKTKVMLIQGTRSKWTHDRTEGNYKIFF